MKKFIYNIISFGSVFILILILFDFIVTTGLKKDTSNRYETWNRILNSEMSADITIYGTSRAYHMYNPVIIDSTLHCRSYNLGMSEVGFSGQYLRFKLYEKYNKSPKLIILNFDYTMFRKYSNVENEQYLPYIRESEFRKIFKLVGLNYFDLYIPFHRYMGRKELISLGAKNFLSGNETSYSNHFKGFYAREKSYNGIDDFDRISRYHDELHIVEFDDLILSEINDFADYCEDNNIKILLVHSPIFIDLKNNITNNDLMIDLMKSLTVKYDNLNYLDYSEDKMSLCQSYFFDALHLNNKGADLFTRKLALDIDSLGILKK